MSKNPSFDHFAQLPTEIRLKIWSVVLSTPRIVSITCERGIHPTLRRYAKAFTASIPNPALLRVNHEARHEALRVYRAHFCTEHVSNCIYMAFDQDVLQLPEDVLGYVGKAELDNVRSMIVEVIDSSYFGNFNMDILRRMPRLRELELVVNEKRGVERRQFVATIKEDFQEAMAMDPEWECPPVRIVSRETGEEMGVIKGDQQ